jgi:putative iron-regulated protein
MRRTKLSLIAAVASAALATPAAAAVAPAAVLDTYADIAQAMYGDSLEAGRRLQAAVDAFLAAPSEATQAAAREAWVAARVPYQQTEAYRFGNAAVDEWEGKVNAWPLDEGLIDYVAASYGEASDENPLYRLNVIANPKLRVGPDEVDASTIDAGLLRGLQEALDVEANVAIGYHAVEFLLWGQDLNGTGPGRGERPWTDYAQGDGCTNRNCDRRRDYLRVATGLLVEDLAEMAAAWAPGGEARSQLEAKGEAGGLSAILTGIGSLSYGELAGERMKLGLLLHDPEEEHDCFSDNTHNSHYYNQVGMLAIWDGSYQRTDGSKVEGPSVADLAAERAPDAKAAVDRAMADALARLEEVKDAADGGRMAYDQMLAEGNEEGGRMLQAAIDALVAQTRAVEGAVAGLGVEITVEGSDSLDNPGAVAQ